MFPSDLFDGDGLTVEAPAPACPLKTGEKDEVLADRVRRKWCAQGECGASGCPGGQDSCWAGADLLLTE
jgi:hypothetical protein